MTEFMHGRCVKWLDRFERTCRRQIDEIERRHKARLVTAVPDIGVCCRDEGFDGRVALRLGRERLFGDGEAVDLRDRGHQTICSKSYAKRPDLRLARRRGGGPSHASPTAR